MHGQQYIKRFILYIVENNEEGGGIHCLLFYLVSYKMPHLHGPVSLWTQQCEVSRSDESGFLIMGDDGGVVQNARIK